MNNIKIISDLKNNETLYLFRLDHETYDLWDALDELEESILCKDIDDISSFEIIN